MSDTMFIAMICFPWVLAVIFFSQFLSERKTRKHWQNSYWQMDKEHNKMESDRFNRKLKTYNDLCEIKKIIENIEVV